jgi:DNA end-binding protein Ku
MAQAFWKGELKLALVSCPVRLVPAIEPKAGVHFHWLNPETHHRVNMVPTDPTTGAVARSSLVRGFEVSKDRYVVLTDKDFEKAKVESTRVVDLEKFVPWEEVAPIYLDAPYYVQPEGKQATETYRVIHQAMLDEGCVGLGHVVIGQRERLVMVTPGKHGFVLYTLHTDREVREQQPIPKGKVDQELVQIARTILAKKRGHFNTGEFKDRYEEALRKVIRAKKKGHTVRATPKSRPGHKVVSLEEALKQSLPQPRSRPKKRRAA